MVFGYLLFFCLLSCDILKRIIRQSIDSYRNAILGLKFFGDLLTSSVLYLNDLKTIIVILYYNYNFETECISFAY